MAGSLGRSSCKWHDAAAGLTVVNSEEGPAVAFLFLVSTRYVLGQQVQCLVSAMAGHFLTSNHLQQREKDGFQVFSCIYRGTVEGGNPVCQVRSTRENIKKSLRYKCKFFLTQNQGLFFSIFPRITTSEGVINALEEVAGCQGDLFIVDSHDAAHLINTHHVNNSHCLFRLEEIHMK